MTPSRAACACTLHIYIAAGNQSGYTRHWFTLQWEIYTMLDILAYAFGTFYFVVIVVFILAAIISGFGGWHR